MNHDDSGVTKWRCPLCREWRREPMRRECASCRKEEHGRMELPDECAAPALVQERDEPVQAVVDPGDFSLQTESVSEPGPVRSVPVEVTPDDRAKPARKKPGDRFPAVRGKVLELDAGCAEKWPSSPAIDAIRAFFEEPGRRATAAEVAQLVMTDVGHPRALVAYLKRLGHLKEVDS